MIRDNLLLILRSLIQLEANLFRTMRIHERRATRRRCDAVQSALGSGGIIIIVARRSPRPPQRSLTRRRWLAEGVGQ